MRICGQGVRAAADAEVGCSPTCERRWHPPGGRGVQQHRASAALSRSPPTTAVHADCAATPVRGRRDIRERPTWSAPMFDRSVGDVASYGGQSPISERGGRGVELGVFRLLHHAHALSWFCWRLGSLPGSDKATAEEHTRRWITTLAIRRAAAHDDDRDVAKCGSRSWFAEKRHEGDVGRQARVAV